jgi:hypothetical protein
MAGLLADVYSFGNRTRNKLRGLLDDPVGTIQQAADATAEGVRNLTGQNETAQQFALRDSINSGDKNALAEYKRLEQVIQNKLFDLATNFNPAAVGMIRTQVGRIPETASETRMLADLLQRAGEKAGYVVRRNDSAISPSRYVSFTKAGDEIGDTTRQVRISNHIDKYPELADGIRTSIDPTTAVSFEQAVNWLGREGFPTNLSARYKDVPSWEQYYANQSAARASEQSRLDGLLGAWRNLPKATRGDMPTLDDVSAGMTAIDLMRRGTLK